MPCKGCNSSTPGKTRCVVCSAKWCNSCLDEHAEKRSSGWKCNECVGTPSKKAAKTDYMTLQKEEFIKRNNLQYMSEWQRCQMLREEGFW